MIAKLFDKIKSHQYRIFLGVCIVLISFISYNLGKINSSSKAPLKITEGANIYKAVEQEEKGIVSTPKITPKPIDLRVVVSKKSSSKVYHYTWCPGAKQIKEENKVWFASAQEAESKGYKLAGNCNK